MFVCLGFGHFILFVYFFPWPRSSKGPRMGRQFFKNVDFSLLLQYCLGFGPLSSKGECNSLKTLFFPSLLEIVFCRTV